MPVRGDRFSDWGRVAVEEGNVGLWEGRQFQYFWRKIDLAANAVTWIKFQTDVDLQVINQSLEVSTGRVLLEFMAGVTDAGTWTPVLRTALNTSDRLRRQPVYHSGVNVFEGGAPTGTGIVANAMVISAATGNTAMTNSATFAEKTVLGPGTYFLEATALLANSSFIYRSIWEEVPEVTGWESGSV